MDIQTQKIIRNKKILFKRTIEYELNKFSIVSSSKYTVINYENFDIHCAEKDILKLKNKNDILKTFTLKELLLYFQTNIKNGIFALVIGDEIYMGGELFSTSLFWTKVNNHLIISDSSNDLATVFNYCLSKSRIAMNLIHSLPYYPFQNKALWENVETLNPLNVLRYDNSRSLEELKIWRSNPICKDFEKKSCDLKFELLGVLSSSSKKMKVSSDLSGGVDSGLLVYFLKKLKIEMDLFHATSDSINNSDTMWAEWIATDINCEVTKLASLSNSGSNFKLDEKTENLDSLDFPIFWSDTEGYVKEISKKIGNNYDAVHFMGLGGDELFSPMPSFIWSFVRENKFKFFSIGFGYCLLNRVPVFLGFKNLSSNKSFKNAISLNVESAFNGSRQTKDYHNIDWNDEVVIPSWLTSEYRIKVFDEITKQIESCVDSLSDDRSQHQMIESILFQNRIVKQINQLYGRGNITWKAPFLDTKIIDIALTIPVKYRQSKNIIKPILYNASKGIASEEIFKRMSKGDYSSSLYKSYKNAVKNIIDDVPNFQLVELGIVNSDLLLNKLSMPSANHHDIESFERLIAIERWVRQFKKN